MGAKAVFLNGENELLKHAETIGISSLRKKSLLRDTLHDQSYLHGGTKHGNSTSQTVVTQSLPMMQSSTVACFHESMDLRSTDHL